MDLERLVTIFGAKRGVVLAEVVGQYTQHPNVMAVTVGGSVASDFEDGFSDLDIFIYRANKIPKAYREEFLGRRTERYVLDSDYRESGELCDRWVAPSLDKQVDLIYRCPVWFAHALEKVARDFDVAPGSSTCLLYGLKNSIPVFDRCGWYAALQDRYRQDYPSKLKQAVLNKNYPLLRSGQSSSLSQIAVAHERGDCLGVFKYGVTFLASYLDIVFAINGVLHPGGKRMMEHVECLESKPKDIERLIRAFLISQHGELSSILEAGGLLVDALDDLIVRMEHML